MVQLNNTPVKLAVSMSPTAHSIIKGYDGLFMSQGGSLGFVYAIELCAFVMCFPGGLHLMHLSETIQQFSSCYSTNELSIVVHITKVLWPTL